MEFHQKIDILIRITELLNVRLNNIKKFNLILLEGKIEGKTIKYKNCNIYIDDLRNELKLEKKLYKKLKKDYTYHSKDFMQ
jgi:hypothetical protein